MKKIKYELNGEWVEIEVTDSFAESYELITQESTRNDWKHNKRNQCLVLMVLRKLSVKTLLKA